MLPSDTAPDKKLPDDSAYHFAEEIVRRLVEGHHTAFFAGGCVRDRLLGIVPHDYDVATSATPDQVQAIFGKRNTVQVGVSFGVVCVHGTQAGEAFQVEVATFRKDGPYSDGRHPDSVEFTDAKHDALRRDFTINGLFYDPIHHQVLDYVDGSSDLQLGIIRAIGNPLDRFREDKLRMIRSIRFAARFDFQIHPETENAMRAMANEVVAVSPERIAMELRKMLVLPNRSWAIEQLWCTGLLRWISQPLFEHWQDQTRRTESLHVLAGLNESDFVTSLAACVYGLIGSSDWTSESLTRHLKQAWKLSNQESVALNYILRAVPILLRANTLAWSALQPILIDHRVSSALDVANSTAKVVGIATDGIDRCCQALQLPYAKLNPAPLVLGDDLIQIGLKPSPLFSKLLQSVRDKQLDGELRDRSSAMAWIRSQIDA